MCRASRSTESIDVTLKRSFCFTGGAPWESLWRSHTRHVSPGFSHLIQQAGDPAREHHRSDSERNTEGGEHRSLAKHVAHVRWPAQARGVETAFRKPGWREVFDTESPAAEETTAHAPSPCWQLSHCLGIPVKNPSNRVAPAKRRGKVAVYTRRSMRAT